MTDPAQVTTAIRRALGLPELPDPQTISAIGLVLGARLALFVLDNVERVSDAAPQILGPLATCPSLTVLVPSRAVLYVCNEQEFPLAPPSTPPASGTTPECLAQSLAVAQFYERAKSARAFLQASLDHGARGRHGRQAGRVSARCPARSDRLPALRTAPGDRFAARRPAATGEGVPRPTPAHPPTYIYAEPPQPASPHRWVIFQMWRRYLPAKT